MKTKFLIAASALLLPYVGFAKATQVSETPGRFQLIQLSEMRRDQFLLDTATGKIWNKVCIRFESGECKSGGWSLEAIEGITLSPAAWLALGKAPAEEKKKTEESPANVQ